MECAHSSALAVKKPHSKLQQIVSLQPRLLDFAFKAAKFAAEQSSGAESKAHSQVRAVYHLEISCCKLACEANGLSPGMIANYSGSTVDNPLFTCACLCTSRASSALREDERSLDRCKVMNA